MIQARCLASLVVPGEAVRIGGIDLVPLIARHPLELPRFELLEDALRSERTSITEIGESGIVGEVLVKHDGDAPLFLLDGEEIIGAKQNRTFNGSFVIAAGTQIRIPVSCVEKGRWSHASADQKFGSTPRTIVTSVRAEKVRGTVKTLVSSNTYASDQGRVWTSVTDYSTKRRTTSRTESLSDSMVARVDEVRAAVEAMGIAPGQIGLASVAGGKLLAADILGSPELYARVHRKIALGLAAEVHDGPRSLRPPSLIVGDALADVSGRATHATAAPGRGTTVVTQAPDHVATELVDDGRAVHAVVVPA